MPGLEAAKAYVAFVGSVAVALLGVFTGDTTVGQILTVVVVIATAITTYQVPNQRPVLNKSGTKRNEYGYVHGGGPYWVYVVGIVLLILILLVVTGVIHVG